MSEPITGNCTDSPNPDLWFPDRINGRPTPHKYHALAKEINLAISECISCPSRQKCLDDGMKPENINDGIWGGLMAGARLKLKGYKKDSFYIESNERNAIEFYEQMLPYLKGEV